MKEFSISARPIEIDRKKLLTLKQRWLIAGLICLFYFSISLIWGEISFEDILLCCIYSLIFIASSSTKPTLNTHVEQKLVFGIDNLVLKSSDTIHWHIPFHRLDRIEQAISGPKWAPASTALIHTNDNDSYLISGELSPETIEEIQQEIDRIKLSTQGRTNEQTH